MKLKKIFYYFLSIFVVLLVWELISRKGPVSQALFPPPTEVAVAWFGLLLSGVLLSDIKQSLWRLLIGLLFGGFSAVLIGLLTGRIKLFRYIFSPLIQTLRPLPAVSIIPLVIVWLGIDDGAKISTIAFGAFFPIWIGTHIGTEQIPNIYLWSAKLFRISKLKLFYKIIFPASLPFIFAGVRTGTAIAYAMVFISELAGASGGVGYRIVVTQSIYRIDQMMAALFTLGLLGATTDWVIVRLNKKLTPWFNHYSNESNYN